MATTNLISKSLGDVLTESGNGTPNHVSPRGSLYVDQDTGVLWQNKDGSTAWVEFSTAAYTEGYYQDNTTATSISATNTWTSVGNNFTLGSSVGFSGSTNSLVLISGYDGKYSIRGDVTLSYVAGTNNYEAGVSINSANPVAGAYNGTDINSTYIRQHIGFETFVDLVGGDTIQFAVRNLNTTGNVIVRHAQMQLRKVN